MGSLLDLALDRGECSPTMARPLRVECAGALYHVTARGNAREPIYKEHPDRARFLGGR